MSNSSQVLYSLQCEHVAPGPATLVSGSLVCAWCRTRKTITGVVEYEWHAKCIDNGSGLVKYGKPVGCSFSRWAGLSKHNAGIFADGHCRHNPGHKVMVEYARNPVAVRTAYKFKIWTERRQRV